MNEEQIFLQRKCWMFPFWRKLPQPKPISWTLGPLNWNFMRTYEAADVPVHNLATSKTYPQDDLRKRYRSLWNKGVSYIGLTFFSEPSYSVTVLLEIHTKNWSFHDSQLTVQKVPWVDSPTSPCRSPNFSIEVHRLQGAPSDGKT